jgi:creatinine amidohydrolase/Fe(II)-dependent formamide hydrolase-like protein
MGDPMTASAEKGERIFAAIVQKLGRLIQQIRSGGIWSRRFA